MMDVRFTPAARNPAQDRGKIPARERLGGSAEGFLAGRVGAEADGLALEEHHLPGRQGRLLFAYLATENGRPVPRDELADLLWGDALPATWEKALTVLASKLRTVLSETGVDGATALTAALVYTARAQRADQDEYVAAMTSVYRQTSEGWKLVIHQQTPL